MKDETVAALGRFHGDMPHASRGEISLLSRHDNEPDHRGVGPDRVGRCHANVAGDMPCDAVHTSPSGAVSTLEHHHHRPRLHRVHRASDLPAYACHFCSA